MRKFIILFTLWFSLSLSANAQFPYSFSVYYDDYKPLTSSTTTVNSTLWFNSDIYNLPLGFDFSVDTTVCHTPAIEGGSTFVTDTGKGTISGFYLTDANLIDRGFLDSIPSTKSPIRYTISGAAGHQIFKLEIANAAFFNEILYPDHNDSVNMQLWLYEDSKIVELRYGPSNVRHGYNYFPKDGHPTVGYVRDIDYALNGTYYILNGNPSNPDIDTIYSTDGDYDHDPIGLSYFPPDGIVYRFTPIALGIANQTAINDTRIYPTICNANINVEYSAAEKANYKIVAVNGAATNISGNLQTGLTKIDISSLAAGMYIIQLQSSSGNKVQKFVKQ